MTIRISQHYPHLHSIGSTTDFNQDFQLQDRETGLIRGIYYPETRRSMVFLGRHESIEDLINTCVHETIHQCLFSLIYEEDAEYKTRLIDIHEEHDMIRDIAWMDLDTIFDDNTNDSIFNTKSIKPKLSINGYKILMKKYNKQADKIPECC